MSWGISLGYTAPTSTVFGRFTTKTDDDTDTTLTTSNVDALASLSGLKSGLESTRIVAEGQSAAAKAGAEGADAEITAYETSGAISEENARIAGIAGDIAILQQQREVARASGAASAAAGAGGVIAGGGVLDVLRSSYQQGALGAQLLGVQTALEQGGYYAQSAATDAQAAAARAQKNASLAEADAYTAQATQAASQIAQLQSLYKKQFDQLKKLEENPTEDANPATGGSTSFLDYGSATRRKQLTNFGNLGA